jgi:hypothetical protein
MKVILSRKGFDSKYGGIPSPILPDGTLLSLPVISDEEDKVCYEDLTCEIKNYEGKTYERKTYAKIIDELKNGKSFEYVNCHLDPDIREDIKERSANWKPAFGQSSRAVKHLNNQNVKEGDLFLFFGWFKQTKYDDKSGNLSYVGGDLHVIWSYLQIGSILKNPTSKEHSYLDKHPHLDRGDKKNNTIFVASDKLSFDPPKEGAGCFKYNKRIVLTRDGMTRSRWNLTDYFKEPVKITYHKEKDWKWNDNFFQSASIGQEFVFEENQKVEEWAEDLINSADITK